MMGTSTNVLRGGDFGESQHTRAVYRGLARQLSDSELQGQPTPPHVDPIPQLRSRD